MGTAYLDECGKTPDGLRVRAITDMMGAQVVVTDDDYPEKDSLLSEPLNSHTEAIELGKRVAEHGVGVYPSWRRPINSLSEFVDVLTQSVVKDYR